MPLDQNGRKAFQTVQTANKNKKIDVLFRKALVFPQTKK